MSIRNTLAETRIWDGNHIKSYTRQTRKSTNRLPIHIARSKWIEHSAIAWWYRRQRLCNTTTRTKISFQFIRCKYFWINFCWKFYKNVVLSYEQKNVLNCLSNLATSLCVLDDQVHKIWINSFDMIALWNAKIKMT